MEPNAKPRKHRPRQPMGGRPTGAGRDLAIFGVVVAALYGAFKGALSRAKKKLREARESRS